MGGWGWAELQEINAAIHWQVGGWAVYLQSLANPRAGQVTDMVVGEKWSKVRMRFDLQCGTH
jgi:hypothetical protein